MDKKILVKVFLKIILVLGIFLFLSFSSLPFIKSFDYGHNSNDVYVRVKGVTISLQEAIDSGALFPDALLTSSSSGLGNSQVIQSAPSAGYYSNSLCVLLKSGGVVKCTGGNEYGQLGVGDNYQRSRFETVAFGSDEKVKSVFNMGRLEYCAILESGKAKCWGYNGYGQLGDGTTDSKNIPSFIIDNSTGDHLQNVSYLVGLRAIYNYEHVCALTTKNSGNLYCWGYNGYGQLGIGSTTSQKKAVNVGFFNNKFVQEIHIGGYNSGAYSCAITDENSGNLYCWGYNGYGQVGDGTTAYKTTPTKVVLPSKVYGVELSTTDMGTVCAIVGDNRDLYCWGYNGYGQVGDGTTTERHAPYNTGLSGITKLKFIGAGYENTICALKDNGDLYCWGYNGYGQVGDGTTNYKTTPVKVSSLLNVKDIVGYGYGYYGHFCTIVGDNRDVYCWGYNGYGQLGLGSSANSYYTTPQKIAQISNVKNISCGGYYSGNTCSAILSDETLRVWGYNGYGNLGTGDTLNKYIPSITV